MAQRPFGGPSGRYEPHQKKDYEDKEEYNYGIRGGRFRRYYCHECDVQLHDEENFVKHQNGGPHLKNLQRIREMSFRRNEDGSLRTGMENDEKPSHYQERIASFYKAKESAEPSSPGRSRDTSRSPRSRYRSRSPSVGGRGYQRRRSRSRSYSRSPRQPSYSRSPHYSRARSRSHSRSPQPKSHRRCRSRSGSPTFAKRAQAPPGSNFQIPECVVKVDGKYKCTLCRAEAKTLDILQAHLSSKGHRKRTAPPTEYRCEPCRLVVSSEETLRQHFEGMAHMRVVKVGEINQKKAAEASFGRFPSTSNVSGPSPTCRDCSFMIEKCQEQDKKIRNLQNQNQRLIKELEYYKRNHAINIKAEQGGGGIGIE